MDKIILKIHNHDFYIHTWGDSKKPLLIFLHGYLDSGASFDSIAKRLSSKFYCIAPDLRGHGKTQTPDPLTGFYFFDYVFDCYKIFEHFSKGPYNLIGHSMGGNIASIYAGTFPEKVSSFVNLEALGVESRPYDHAPKLLRKWIESSPSQYSFKSSADYLKRLRKRAPNLDKNLEEVLLDALTFPSPEGRTLRAHKEHLRPHPVLFRWEMLREFYKNITCPILYLFGENSHMNWMGENVDEEIRIRLKSYKGDLQQKKILNAGHMLHWEVPEVITNEINDFFAKNS